jgi:hypothetical protein
MERSSKEWLVPLTGVAFILVVVAGFLVAGDEPPEAKEGGQKIIDFYVDNKDSVQISDFIGVAAGVLLVFFFSYVGKVVTAALGERRSMLPTVAIVGAGIVAVGVAIDSTIQFALAEAADDIDPAAAQAVQAIWDNDFLPFILGTSLAMLATGIGVVRSGALPAWLGWVAVVIGIVAVTPFGFAGVIATALWILVASVMLTSRARGASGAATA